MNIPYPNITAGTPAEQIGQLKSFLFQLVEQLNLGEIRTEVVRTGNAAAASASSGSAGLQNAPAGTFEQIKSMIIKSADIVKAIEDTMTENFNGKYFAESDFGTYLDNTRLTINTTSERVTETYDKVQEIDGTVAGIEKEVQTINAWIRRGLLDDGEYGIEIGRMLDGGTFRRYARFTSEKLSFHDKNENVVAYIGAGAADEEDANCLYITGRAVFEKNIKVGGYMMDTTDGLAFVWVGG